MRKRLSNHHRDDSFIRYATVAVFILMLNKCFAYPYDVSESKGQLKYGSIIPLLKEMGL